MMISYVKKENIRELFLSKTFRNAPVADTRRREEEGEAGG